ncbi:cobaltochelatase subunit CobN [Streptosporangium amethystogenes subsp. fukuiense]
MRTAGDDVAEVLALLGVRPVWDEASRRSAASNRSRSPNSAGPGST